MNKKKDFLVKKSLVKHLLTKGSQIVKMCCQAILSFIRSHFFTILLASLTHLPYICC